MSTDISIGALVATILMTGGCVAYVFLCCLLCFHRACQRRGDSNEDGDYDSSVSITDSDIDRCDAIDAVLIDKVSAELHTTLDETLVLTF